ncbi:hypothetical protein JZ751_018855 [Albula glossodonta]|uniref:Uncharacterized protein n=1 Tax=Albula glossodonta TaxID=121402 RepID=A0A8T2MU02_9TELE|nr:hypothetical protein JZ751_018855 [Albula glossodonta]
MDLRPEASPPESLAMAFVCEYSFSREAGRKAWSPGLAASVAVIMWRQRIPSILGNALSQRDAPHRNFFFFDGLKGSGVVDYFEYSKLLSKPSPVLQRLLHINSQIMIHFTSEPVDMSEADLCFTCASCSGAVSEQADWQRLRSTMQSDWHAGTHTWAPLHLLPLPLIHKPLPNRLTEFSAKLSIRLSITSSIFSAALFLTRLIM